MQQPDASMVAMRSSKRDFLDKMNLVIPWTELLAIIGPHTPAGKTGRPPFPAEVMLRIHQLQKFCGHLNPAMEDALHDIPLCPESAHLDAGITRRPMRAPSCTFDTCLKSTCWTSRYWSLSTPS
jgi:IS5 family transposase